MNSLLRFDVMMGVWVISDTHWGHDNIIRFCKRPENHDRLMMDNWYNTVEPNDVILHLGDVGLRGPKGEKLQEEFKHLPGHKYLVRGNHDTKPDEFYESLGFKAVMPHVQMVVPDGPIISLTHYPMEKGMSREVINIHGHIHNNGYDKGTPEFDYRNVSVEVMDYKPVKLRDIVYGNSFQSRLEGGINSYEPR